MSRSRFALDHMTHGNAIATPGQNGGHVAPVAGAAPKPLLPPQGLVNFLSCGQSHACAIGSDAISSTSCAPNNGIQHSASGPASVSHAQVDSFVSGRPALGIQTAGIHTDEINNYNINNHDLLSPLSNSSDSTSLYGSDLDMLLGLLTPWTLPSQTSQHQDYQPATPVSLSPVTPTSAISFDSLIPMPTTAMLPTFPTMQQAFMNGFAQQNGTQAMMQASMAAGSNRLIHAPACDYTNGGFGPNVFGPDTQSFPTIPISVPFDTHGVVDACGNAATGNAVHSLVTAGVNNSNEASVAESCRALASTIASCAESESSGGRAEPRVRVFTAKPRVARPPNPRVGLMDAVETAAAIASKPTISTALTPTLSIASEPEIKLSPTLITPEFQLSPVSLNHEFELSPLSLSTDFQLSPESLNHDFQLSPISLNHEFQLSPLSLSTDFQLSPALLNHEFQLSPISLTPTLSLNGVNETEKDEKMTITTPTTTSKTPRRRPRSTDGHGAAVGRPRNAFIIYRSERHAEIAKKHPDLRVKDISKVVAATWRDEDEAVKAQYRARAELEKAVHAAMYPDFRFQRRSDSEIVRRGERRKAQLLKQRMGLSNASGASNVDAK